MKPHNRKPRLHSSLAIKNFALSLITKQKKAPRAVKTACGAFFRAKLPIVRYKNRPYCIK